MTWNVEKRKSLKKLNFSNSRNVIGLLKFAHYDVQFSFSFIKEFFFFLTPKEITNMWMKAQEKTKVKSKGYEMTTPKNPSQLVLRKVYFLSSFPSMMTRDWNDTNPFDETALEWFYPFLKKGFSIPLCL